MHDLFEEAENFEPITEEHIKDVELQVQRRHPPCSCGSFDVTKEGYYVRTCVVHDESTFRRYVLKKLDALSRLLPNE